MENEHITDDDKKPIYKWCHELGDLRYTEKELGGPLDDDYQLNLEPYQKVYISKDNQVHY
jgi:hypothetical protein